ncbi:MAG TPA: signal peptidase II [Rhizomicrobium sp.]
MTLLPRDWGLAAAAGALVLDQASKLTMLYGFGFKDMTAGEAVPVLPFFNMVMVWNPGVSYGLFPAHSRFGSISLVFLSLLAVGGLGWWLWNAHRRSLGIGLGLVIGGAIGNNLIDRLIYGKVADFFHFYGLGYDWYVFNVADAAITFGVIALLYDALMRPDDGSGSLKQVSRE